MTVYDHVAEELWENRGKLILRFEHEDEEPHFRGFISSILATYRHEIKNSFAWEHHEFYAGMQIIVDAGSNPNMFHRVKTAQYSGSRVRTFSEFSAEFVEEPPLVSVGVPLSALF